MKTVAGTISFDGYRVNELFFAKKKPDKPAIPTEKPSFSPVFSRVIESDDMGSCLVTLSVKIGDEPEDSVPFSIRVSLTGKFTINEKERAKEIMEVNGTAILFPYLRSTVSQLTLSANLSPVILPTINLVEMLNNERKAKED